MEKLKWIDKVTNEEVLRSMGKERPLLSTIIKRKGNWIVQRFLHDVVYEK